MKGELIQDTIVKQKNVNVKTDVNMEADTETDQSNLIQDSEPMPVKVKEKETGNLEMDENIKIEVNEPLDTDNQQANTNVQIKKFIKDEADVDMNESLETCNLHVDNGNPKTQGTIHKKSDKKKSAIIILSNNATNQSVPKIDISNINKMGKVKRKRKRPAMRRYVKKRLLATQNKVTISTAGETGAEAINSAEAQLDDIDVEYCLTVTNLPNNWSFMDIKNYIDTVCGPVDEIEMLKDEHTGNGAIRLSYPTKGECNEAMFKLKDKEIDGKKLILEMSEVGLEFENSPPTPPPPTSSEPEAPPGAVVEQWRPDLDSWQIDPQGTYGLKPAFLKSLGITPPLDKWVHVSNFRCDKSDLKDILDMAGTVLMCSVFNAVSKYANVMYSHPLEAVQAVSMLNSQMFYGQSLKVVMDRSPQNTIVLPKGLTGIGQGLGANGKPLRNIFKHYQRLLANQSTNINRIAFEIPKHLEQSVSNEEPFTVKNVSDFNYLIRKDAIKSTVTTSATTTTVIKTTVTKPTPAVQTPVNPIQTMTKVAQSPVTSPTPKSNFKAHNNQPRKAFGQNFGVSQGQGWNGPRPMGPMPRPMPGPMHGTQSMQGPMNGARPMPGPMNRPPGPMPTPLMGPMPGPGPMRGPMTGPPGSMQGPRPGPMQGPMPVPMQGQMTGPMQGSMSGPMHGPMPGQMQGPMQRPMQGPMQGPMSGPMQGPMPGPMQGSMPGPMPGQMPGQMPGPMAGPMQGPMQGQMPMQIPVTPGSMGHFGNEPVQLQLINLPPSTTFQVLREKMSQCGQVVSIQLTTPGCAVVTFANRMLADRCYQTYHGQCIEGRIMQVKYT